MKFIVEVRSPLPEDLAGVAEKLAEAFNISRAKANGLLRRAPGPVTKPVSEREASVVAGIFESAGLSVATLPEPDVLRSTGATEVRTEPWKATPADVAETGTGVEGIRTGSAGTAAGDGVAADATGVTAGFDDAHADADGLEVLPDEGSRSGVHVRGAEVHDEGDRDAGTGAPSWRRSSDGEFPRGDGVMADRQDEVYARFGEATAASTVVEPLRDDGLEDAVLEGAAREDYALHHEAPSDVAHLDVAHLNDDHLDDAHLDDDHLDVAAEDDFDGVGGTHGTGRGFTVADGAVPSAGTSGRAQDDAWPMGAGDGRPGDVDGVAGVGHYDVFAVPGAAPIAGGVAAASRSAGAPEEDETEQAEQGAVDGESSTDTGSTAAAYRSDVRELQRHGGTTAAELGMHARNATQREATPSGVRRRIVAVGIWPALLTLVVVVVSAALTLLPVMRQQQVAAAHRAASSFASSVEGVSAGLPLGAPIVNSVLSDVAARSQARLVGQGVDYMVITDDQGLPLAGWYGSAAGLTNLPPDVGREVAAAAAAAADADVTPRETLGQGLAASWRDLLAMLGLGKVQGQVGSAAIRDGGNLMGTVVVGMDPASQLSDAGRALLATLLLGLIPVLIGIFAAMALARRVTGGLRYLLDAADRISRGDLEHAVQLDSKDELGQLARAIERMRVSLQEGLERLRRRR